MDVAKLNCQQNTIHVMIDILLDVLYEICENIFQKCNENKSIGQSKDLYLKSKLCNWFEGVLLLPPNKHV